MRRALVSLLVGCCMLVGGPAGVAHAEFAPVSWPCASTGVVSGFAASGSTWLALCDNVAGMWAERVARTTRDEGRTWADVSSGGTAVKLPPARGVTVGPDGAFYIGAVDTIGAATGRGRLIRIEAASGALTSTPLDLPITSNRSISPPAWDGAGRMWIAYADADSKLTLARLTDALSADFTAVGPLVNTRQNLEIRFFAAGTYVRSGLHAHRLNGTGFTRVPAGMPVLEDGQLVVGQGGVSVDGGASFMTSAGGAYAVEGDPSLLFDSHRVLTRLSSAAFFAPTGLESPVKLTRVLRTPAGLIGVSDQWRDAEVDTRPEAPRLIGLHRGAVPPLPFSSGPLNATATAMVARANEFRAQAGLTGLIGDPLISQAAENHSRYWALNARPDGISAHAEIPGTPGYTGESMLERCAAVGASCNSEIYGSGVDGWVATIYHRMLIMEPRALVVGAGRAEGGAGVMNGGRAGGVQYGPVPFPLGRYDGPLSFAGETPDPTEACNDSQQPVDWPLGTAVTLFVPGGSVSSLTVTPQRGAPLRGCVLDDTFMSDDPLSPGTTYTASAVWTPGRNAAPRPVTWTFTTSGRSDEDDEGTGGSRCKPSLKRAATKVRKPASVRVRYRSCAAGNVTAGVYRLKPKTKRQKRALVTRTVKLGGKRSGTAALATRKLAPGRYALRATLRTKRAKVKSLSTKITVAKPKKRARVRAAR